MSRGNVTNLLAQLTYRDMVDLSKIVADELGGVTTAEKIASVLCNLPRDNDQTADTSVILHDAFKRKRNITVQPKSGGAYVITCGSFNGASVICEDIREGISQLLDTIVVINTLMD